MHRNITAGCGLLLLVLLWTGAAAAKTLYVTDSFEINLRTGPGNEFRIVALLPSGTKVETLEHGEEWSRVRAENGRDGWLLTRYVSPDPPARVLAEKLQLENQRLRAASEKATEQARGLETEHRDLSGSYEDAQKELEILKQKYASLLSDSENVIQLKERFEQTAAELARMGAEKERLAAENQELRSETRMNWFLAGAGVMGGSLLFGFVMGRLQRRSRRSSLYS